MHQKKINFKKSYLIAETAYNHEGSTDYLYRMIDEISEVGFDAVKFHLLLNIDSLVEIYKILSELTGKFAFKKHPIQSKGTSSLSFSKLFKDCKDIPEWIPAELYFNNIEKNVISVYSTSLSIASQFSHLKAISLLELVEWYNKSFKRDVKRLLIKKSGNKILFPNSFNELKEIINEPRRR